MLNVLGSRRVTHTLLTVPINSCPMGFSRNLGRLSSNGVSPDQQYCLCGVPTPGNMMGSTWDWHNVQRADCCCFTATHTIHLQGVSWAGYVE